MTASPSYPLFDPSDPVFRAHEGGKLGVHATQPLRDAADLARTLIARLSSDITNACYQQDTLRYNPRAHMTMVVLAAGGDIPFRIQAHPVDTPVLSEIVQNPAFVQ